MWFGPDAPHSTCYAPFYCGITALPKSYTVGSLTRFSRDSANWAFDYVSNLADLKYSYMIKDINAKQREVESRQFALQPVIETAALALYEKDPALGTKFLTNYSVENANRTVSEWWALADFLFTKYNDGYVNIPKVGTSVGYPDGWLKAIGFGQIKKP
jgi:dipeptidase